MKMNTAKWTMIFTIGIFVMIAWSMYKDWKYEKDLAADETAAE